MSSETLLNIIRSLLELDKRGNIITDYRFENELHTVKLTVDMIRPPPQKCSCCGK